MGTPHPVKAPVFKRIRIAILLYILLFVALGQFLAAHRSTDWDKSLRVNVYPINASGSVASQEFIDALGRDAFGDAEEFLADQAAAYGVDLQQPVRIRLAEQLDETPPAIPDGGGMLQTMLWSLKMRWFVTRLHWSSDSPTPDITVLALYHDDSDGLALDRSTALRKGLTAIANLYAVRSARGANMMIVSHEVLHTLGASDKYDLTGLPIYPFGFADRDRSPLYPQAKAELMAGRVPIRQDAAVQPKSLHEVMIGPETALEIGWIDELPMASH
jgi:hypothetical protein